MKDAMEDYRWVVVNHFEKGKTNLGVDDLIGPFEYWVDAVAEAEKYDGDSTIILMEPPVRKLTEVILGVGATD